MSQKPIIILGFPRSGTTLMRRLLDAHKNICCPGETFLLRSAARFVRGEQIADDLDYGVRGGIASIGFSDDDLYAALRNMIHGFLGQYAHAQGKQRWAEKTAVNAFYIEEIEALFGNDAQFICLVRHGLDVVSSCHELTTACERVVEELHPYIRANPYPDAAYGEAWADVTSRLIEFNKTHPNTSHLVRYEDLLRNPEQVNREILTFLGEDWDPAVIELGPKELGSVGFGDWKAYDRQGFDNGSVERWRNLSPSVLRRVSEIVNPVLMRCGYEAVETDGTTLSPADAYRRYEMMMKVRAAKSYTS